MSFLFTVVWVAVYLAAYFVWRSHKKCEASSVPYIGKHWVFSNFVFFKYLWHNSALGISKVATQWLDGYYQVFRREGLCVHHYLAKKFFFITNADTLEKFISQPGVNKKGYEYRFFKPWLGDGLLLSGGNKWRTRRKLLTPAFHFRILENFLPEVDKNSKKLVDILEVSSKGGEFDITHVVSRCTLDVICETVMGVHINALDDEHCPFVLNTVRCCNDITNRFLESPLMPDFIYNKTSAGRKFQKSSEYLSHYTRQVIKTRKEMLINNQELLLSLEDIEKNDGEVFKDKKPFLDLLLYHHIVHQSLTEDDIEEEVTTFLFEGHDTSGSCISFTLYLIGQHPDVQRKIQEEVDRVCGKDTETPLNSEHLRDLKYTEMVIKESLRLFPPVPYISREIENDLTIGPHLIPSGTVVAMAIFALHKDEKYFPNPEVFNPDNFLPENCSKRHPFAYLPFSVGPRNCIGQKFAFKELKMVVTNVMRKLDCRSSEYRNNLNVANKVIIRCDEPGLRMNFTKRTF